MIGSEGFVRSIQRTTLFVSRFSSATAEPFHKLAHALVPALFAITVYGYAVGMKRLRLRSKDCWISPELISSNTTLSERLLAMSSRSPFGPGNTANPAG